jgi:hypothetical protein
MKEVIYLVAGSGGVRRMTKNLPSLYKGEIPIKVTVTVEPKAFRTPVIEKEVYVEDWREGIDMADVDFKQTAITPEEAEIIRKNRLKKMSEILKANGYQITKEEPKNA